jgi:uncharacterized protein YjeT (DUF2065 family)
MTYEIVLTTIGLLGFIEACIVLIFPDFSKKTAIKMFKSKESLRKAGFIELVVAVILILIGMNI